MFQKLFSYALLHAPELYVTNVHIEPILESFSLICMISMWLSYGFTIDVFTKFFWIFCEKFQNVIFLVKSQPCHHSGNRDG